MDLRTIEAAPTDAERAAVDAVLGASESAWEGGERQAAEDGHAARGGASIRERRHLLLPALHGVQDRLGWISPGALGYLCRRLTIPPAEAYGVASFYALFALEAQPPVVAHVCDDIACLASGAGALCSDLERTLGPPIGGHGERVDGTDGAGRGSLAWASSPCLGLCDRAPAALVVAAGHPARERAVAPATAGELRESLSDALAGSPNGASPERATALPQAGQEGLRLLRRVGRMDPGSLDDYRAHGGYRALRRAVELGPEGVIREVTDANLLGRGGAAFPTGRKWDAVARTPKRPHYLVCNADESEPGTFKDRVLMEEDPFALLEAMTIAAYATGCEKGFLYIRGEYPLAASRLEGAIAQARQRGLLGEDVMGEGFAFDIELRRGAGAYICGEETALFNSIEGRRGEPRNKPPFPTEAGLFQRPTVVNNVETLVNVLPILEEGAVAYAATGTPASTGTRLLCISGKVARPGLYEVAHGTTLGQALELAGGVAGGGPLRALLLGGAAGSFVGPDRLDLPLTFEDTRAANLSLGSGVVMVFDDTVDLGPIVLRIAQFFRDESCGQCVPCRVGTVRQEELLHRLSSGRTLGTVDDELALFEELAEVMRDASICGLGQTAVGAARSAIVDLGVFTRAAPSGGQP
ncbi:MAG: NAD(P)H-dependent oxidoreductase subunit E [Acidimicrobiales bacterium]|nr:NAD(P)H-dependent oxidoreductase subunit E [Acidimicrobiales bacterium]